MSTASKARALILGLIDAEAEEDFYKESKAEVVSFGQLNIDPRSKSSPELAEILRPNPKDKKGGGNKMII